MEWHWFMVMASLGGTALGWLLKSYTEEKEKNLATKEDTAAITRIVEQVRAEFERDRADRRAEHELRMEAFELKQRPGVGNRAGEIVHGVGRFVDETEALAKEPAFIAAIVAQRR
jgi:hypothetical protein